MGGVSPALEAHLRLLMKTPPERIRTHHQPIVELGRARNANPEPRSKSRAATAWLNRRIKAMKKAGATHREVMAELGVSWTTVSKHVNGHVGK